MNLIKVYKQRPDDFLPTIEVAAIYVNVQDQLLLLELSHNKQEAGFWGVPAGKIERHESPISSAKRELFEETGIEISETSLLSQGQLYIRKPEIDYTYHLFALNLDNMPDIHLSAEHQNYLWASPTEAQTLNLMKGAKEALNHYYRCINEGINS